VALTHCRRGAGPGLDQALAARGIGQSNHQTSLPATDTLNAAVASLAFQTADPHIAAANGDLFPILTAVSDARGSPVV
jgi:hypothetical protein